MFSPLPTDGFYIIMKAAQKTIDGDAQAEQKVPLRGRIVKSGENPAQSRCRVGENMQMDVTGKLGRLHIP